LLPWQHHFWYNCWSSLGKLLVKVSLLLQPIIQVRHENQTSS